MMYVHSAGFVMFQKIQKEKWRGALQYQRVYTTTSVQSTTTVYRRKQITKSHIIMVTFFYSTFFLPLDWFIVAQTGELKNN